MREKDTPTALPVRQTYENLLEDILEQIVEYPDDMHVIEMEVDFGIWLDIEANKKDYGKIIGHKGTIINSLRNLFTAMNRGRQTKIELRDNK
jgi:predicted RNA-binding protein YlqC (UPF0109 family)